MVSWSGNLSVKRRKVCRHTAVFTPFEASACLPSLVKKLQLRMIHSQSYFLGVHGKLRLSFLSSFSYLFPHLQMISTPILQFHIFKYLDMKAHLNYSELPKHSKVKYALLILHPGFQTLGYSEFAHSHFDWQV